MSTDFSAGVRYALIQTSINSLAGNYVAAIVRRALETGLWSADRALRTAAIIPDADRRASMYAAILASGKLSPLQVEEAQSLGLESALLFGSYPPKAFIAMAPHLTDHFLARALDAALDLKGALA